ncbi:DoxX family protein [Rhizobium herbae]|uniref:Oxidoreductase n=1 Tax=Rhizobium herbae TaxID=508661 RepID=A0ABS4EJ88_9HYPH|nr:DoxX family protein [Rhizobium herbae]MBP1858012.1 putative oxidoreductase [Rhizobium herbae]
MKQEQRAAYAAALLRISLGIMYLAHSIVLKFFTFGLAGTAGYFVSIGLPGWLAYLTFAAEAIGGALLVLGVHVRLVSIALMPALAGAILFAHAGNGWVFTAPGGGWEYPLYLLVLSVAQALLGEGAFAWSSLRHSRPAFAR